MSTAELVNIQDAGKTFPLGGAPEYIALRGINLQIRRGEFIAPIGHSGCGKSTRLNIIAGLDLATEGVVSLEGLTITKPGSDRCFPELFTLTVDDSEGKRGFCC